MKSASRTFVMLLAAISVCLPPALRADDGKFAPLKVKLDEYTAAIAGDSFKTQASECDFLISECKDSLARQFTALYLYDHYLNSRIMGDEAVAVHIVDRWFAPGTVKMKNDLDLLNAKVFADFNRSSLIGEKAPELTQRYSPAARSEQFHGHLQGYLQHFPFPYSRSGSIRKRPVRDRRPA